MLALAMFALVGVVGLATDLGYSFVARRTMQNAADASALAGARLVAKSSTSSPLRAESEVTRFAGENGFAGVDPTIESCRYVNDANSELSACSSTVPLGASGVRVIVREVHSTFFMRIFGWESVTVRATATAHVQPATNIPSDGPFIVCGIDTKLASGGTMSILRQNALGQWEVNPAAYGQIFEIHGPQIEKCESKSSRFKGVANQDQNLTDAVPGWFNYTEGDTAGPVRETVQGMEGCKAGHEPLNCIAYLPIAIKTPAESGNNREVWVVALVPFYIEQAGSNTHTGQIVPNYVIYNSGRPRGSGWYQNYPGPIVVRLTS
jgi:hypothetical protein